MANLTFPPTESHPTDSTSILAKMQNNTVLKATFTLLKPNTKVAAFGRHHKTGDAAFGRAASSVVSFVVAMNRVDVVDLVVDLVDVDLDVDLVDVDLDQQYDFCLSRTDLNIVDGLNRTTSKRLES